MIKANMFGGDGKKLKLIELPSQFSEEFRPDIIRRAFLSYMSHNWQPYGSFPKAGQRQSAELSRRRRKFKTAYGYGISRVPRKSLWRRGSQFGWVGAFSPNTVGGRRAHPSKSEKILVKRINKNERRKAIRSALAAAVIPEVVKCRGHIFDELPSVVDSSVEQLSKTKDVIILLKNLKLNGELSRISHAQVRAGKGKMRGRKYKTKKGPLFVVSKECPLINSASNIMGVDVAQVQNLNVALLAPGGHPGRLSIFSEAAIQELKGKNLFFNSDHTKKPMPKSGSEEKVPEEEKPLKAKIEKQETRETKSKIKPEAKEIKQEKSKKALK